MPSFLLILSFVTQQHVKIIVVTNKNIISVKITDETGACPIRPTKPKINEMLMMFEPITFPRAKSFSPFFEATTDVTSSGKLVPKATIVSPTRASLMPIFIAKKLAVVETHSPPKTTAANPKTKYTIICQIFNSFSFKLTSSPIVNRI